MMYQTQGMYHGHSKMPGRLPSQEKPQKQRLSPLPSFLSWRSWRTWRFKNRLCNPPVEDARQLVERFVEDYKHQVAQRNRLGDPRRPLGRSSAGNFRGNLRRAGSETGWSKIAICEKTPKRTRNRKRCV